MGGNTREVVYAANSLSQVSGSHTARWKFGILRGAAAKDATVVQKQAGRFRH
jgi:hypothetical protein